MWPPPERAVRSFSSDPSRPRALRSRSRRRSDGIGRVPRNSHATVRVAGSRAQPPQLRLDHGGLVLANRRSAPCRPLLQRMPAAACRSPSGRFHGTGHGHRPAVAARAEALTECTESTTVFVKASDLTRSLLLEVLPVGKALAVVVVGVLEGSEAEEAGIVPGQRLMAISDPIRPDQMWPLGSSPSLRFIRDTLSVMRNKEVGLQMCMKPLYTAFAEAASDAGSIDEDTIPLVSTTRSAADSTSPDATLGERLAQRYNEAQNVKQTSNNVQKRMQARKAYLDVVSKRNDSNIFVWVFALFLGPALAILATAYFTGYLDSLYINSLSAYN